MKSLKFLDLLIEKRQLKNDAALAEKLSVGKSAISNYRKGIRVMDNEMCLKVALALDIDPLQVIMAADIDRAEKTGQRSLWENFMLRMSVKNNLTLTASEATASNEGANRPICIM